MFICLKQYPTTSEMKEAIKTLTIFQNTFAVHINKIDNHCNVLVISKHVKSVCLILLLVIIYHVLLLYFKNS